MKLPITMTELGFLLSFCLLLSCSREDNSPQIAFPAVLLQSPVIDNPYLGEEGEVVNFNFIATVPGRFNGFTILERKNNMERVLFETTRIVDPSLAERTAFSHDFEYSLGSSGESIKLIFILTDRAGNDVSAEWQLQVK